MKRSPVWLLAAALLLCAAAWLMARGDKPKPLRAAHVEFPRSPSPDEQHRMRDRRTLPALPPKRDEDAPFQMKRDPVLTALPTGKNKTALVFEASALRNSPLGKMWLDCLTTAGDRRDLERFKDRFGVDPLNDVDRFAFAASPDLAVLSGDFGEVKWDALDRSARAHGDKGEIYDGTDRDGQAIGVWDDQIVLLSNDTAAIEAAMDRLEGRGPAAPPPIGEWSSYGDVYGVLSTDDVAKALPESQREIVERLRSAITQVELHADASDDVAIVADVRGLEADAVSDLGKSLGAALAVGRLNAQAEGDERLAELMDYAHVNPRGAQFSVELAMPLEVIRKHMGPCRRADAAADAGR